MNKQKLEWKKAKCPACGEEYQYLFTPIPKTCGKFECLQKANLAGILTTERDNAKRD